MRFREGMSWLMRCVRVAHDRFGKLALLGGAALSRSERLTRTVLMDKLRILIIEDDEDVRTQMDWALNADYDVYLAEDRRTALEVLQREKPAVVTLDLGLPPSPSDTWHSTGG